MTIFQRLCTMLVKIPEYRYCAKQVYSYLCITNQQGRRAYCERGALEAAVRGLYERDPFVGEGM